MLVVLLRGVNVGGHRTFRPTKIAEQLKCFDVVNIGAAGTFVVRRPVAQEQLRREFSQKLPFDAEVIILEGAALVRLLEKDLFADETGGEEVVRFASVLSKSPRTKPALPKVYPEDGKWMMKILAQEGRFVVGVHRRQMKALRYFAGLDRLYGVSATTRSWNTITAIARVLEGRTS